MSDWHEVTIGPCRLICADCMQVLPTLTDIDAVVTDPPYGISVCNRSDGGVGSVSSGSKVYGRESWDSEPASMEAISSILDINVPTCIWGGNYFQLPPTSCWLIWDKCQRDFTFADAELAWTNIKKSVRCFNYGRGELVREGKVHPTQKPVPLMEWSIERIGSTEGDKVLDLFMGSGTTGVACIRTGRKFTGVERERKYFDMAVDRIRRAWQLKCSELPFEEKPTLKQRELL